MYSVNKSKIYENYNKYSNIGKIFYPVKANSSIEILSLLNQLVNKSLINNINQFNKVMSINKNPEKIALMNPLMSDNNIRYLYEQGVRFFVFDNNEKLNIFKSYADMEKVQISIRINTMEIDDTIITNLGTDIVSAKKMLYGLKNSGISFYINPKLKTTNKKCFIKMMDLIKDIENISFLSVGGIPEIEINKNYLINYGKEKNIDIIIEPGKGLLENAIDFKAQIVRINNNIITINRGIFSGFLDKLIYNQEFNIDFIKNGKSIIDKSDGTKIFLFGNSTDSADFIGEYYIKEKIDINTEIIVRNVGTYFNEFVTTYDRKDDEYEIQDV